MQTIILAAGKGKRLGALTEDMPKPMILINGKPLLANTIEKLPKEIDRVIVVIGHQGEKIRNFFKDTYAGRSISYLEIPELNGTAGALFAAKDFLRGRFLVLFGDEHYSSEDLGKIISYPLAMAVFEGMPNHQGYLQVDVHSDGTLAGFRKPTEQEITCGMRIVTGAFVLDDRIFDYKPVRLANGEYGLPQTILEFSKKNPVNAVPLLSWKTITHAQDIEKMELGFK